MKIVSHASLPTKISHKIEQEIRKNPQEKTKTIQQDALKISQNILGGDVKEINQAIGGLQIASKTLQKLETQIQVNLKDEEFASMRKEISNAFANANLGKTNVFDTNYKNFSSHINIDFYALKKEGSNINDSQDAKHFTQSLKIQQNQIKQAISILQNKLNNSLTIDNRDYNQLNPSMLSTDALRNAHNIDNLSLERVSKLLA